jgi:hypothetical protein
MYSRITILSSSILSVLALSLCWLFVWPKEHDRNLYRNYANHALQFSPNAICQSRRKVEKEIWFAQSPNLRLEYRIESASSCLTFAPIGQKIDIVERLEQIRGWMQEKIFSGPQSTQQVRYFTARDGLYRLLSQELIADDAALALYRMAGTTLPDMRTIWSAAPYLSGEASSVAFQISGNSPHFQARNFKAQLGS